MNHTIAFVEARTYFAAVHFNVEVLHAQEDLCYRWLASRRDYPYYRCDPPEVHPRVMRACVSEFTRSNPGFVL